MNRDLSDNILRVMRESVKATSVKDLKKRGLTNVTLLDLRNLDTLIREAVSRTLRQQGVKLSSSEMKTQSDRVKKEFFKVVSEKNSMEAEKKGLEGELDELRRNFQRLAVKVEADRTLLAQEESRIAEDGVSIPDSRLATFESKLRLRLKELFHEPPVDKKLANSVVAAALDLFERERQAAFQEASTEQEQRVLLLKRRLAKLSAKLEETEKVLLQVEEARESGEPLPAHFQDVQELLKTDEKYVEERREALQKMFELNMELKKLFDET